MKQEPVHRGHWNRRRTGEIRSRGRHHGRGWWTILPGGTSGHPSLDTRLDAHKGRMSMCIVVIYAKVTGCRVKYKNIFEELCLVNHCIYIGLYSQIGLAVTNLLQPTAVLIAGCFHPCQSLCSRKSGRRWRVQGLCVCIARTSLNCESPSTYRQEAWWSLTTGAKLTLTSALLNWCEIDANSEASIDSTQLTLERS